MRHIPLTFILVMIGASDSWAQSRPTQPREKPFRNVMLMSGGGGDVARYLGMLEEAEAQLKKKGERIDLIVASCGGAIAAAIANRYPPKERREILSSREFHQFALKLEIGEFDAMKMAGLLSRLKRELKDRAERKQKERSSLYPDLSMSVVSLPKAGYPRRLDETFEEKTPGIPVVIIAAEMDFSPADYGKEMPHGSQPFVETYFTSPAVKKNLGDIQSFIAKEFPQSFASTKVKIRTDVSLYDAVRASIADPFLFPPPCIGDCHYLSGALNLEAFNLVDHLGTSYIGPYKERWDSIEVLALKYVFNFDPDAVSRRQMQHPVSYWVDFTQKPRGYPSFTPGVGFDLSKGGFYLRNPVPRKLEKYRAAVDGQWKHGRERTKEAFTFEPGSRTIFRMPFPGISGHHRGIPK